MTFIYNIRLLLAFLLILSIMPHLTKHALFGIMGLTLIVAIITVGMARTKPSPFCQAHQLPFEYTVCTYHSDSQAKLQLMWQNPNNSLVLNFARLKSLFSGSPEQLEFAMNAGMYDAKFAPIGYTVINGKQIRSLNLKQGGGNFHLMPNGVFWADSKGYHISESQTMAKLLSEGIKPKFATQSGPMLVINGKIHPSFDPKSTSFKLRNGVGICHDGTVKFVISDTWVSFYQFADLFKTQLKCDNALFLDGGSASALYSRELNRTDDKYMGVMVVATSQK